MKLYIIFFSSVLCFVFVNAQKMTMDESKLEEITVVDDDQSKLKNDGRHRRKRWHMDYGYNFPPPPNHYYFEDRRETSNQQMLLPHIVSLLEEIAAYVKRPPPPPQPIYIPYPLLYPSSPYCKCPNVSNAPQNQTTPSITERLPEMEDSNQNWGFVESEETSDAGSDGARPISFEPIPPKQTLKRPQPPVEHGSSQGGSEITTQNPLRATSSSDNRPPSRCDAAVLACCGPNSSNLQQRKCFNNLGCDSYFAKGNACSPERFTKALEAVSKAYSVNKNY